MEELELLVTQLKKEIAALRAHSAHLQAQIDYMLSPEFDPKKGLPEVCVTIVDCDQTTHH